MRLYGILDRISFAISDLSDFLTKIEIAYYEIKMQRSKRRTREMEAIERLERLTNEDKEVKEVYDVSNKVH